MKQNGNTYKYSPIAIAQFKMWLQDMKEQGQTKFFEVFVDELIVVAKTENADDFDKHEQYLDEDSKVVRVFIYNTTGSHRYKQRIFKLDNEEQTVKPEVQIQNNGLSGAEVQTKIDESVERAKEKWDTEALKKELEAANKKVADAEEYIEKLQARLDEANGKNLQKENLGEITSLVKEVIPHFMNSKPNENGSLSGSEKKPEGEATFKKKSEGEQKTNSQEEQRYVSIVKQMEEHFDQEQLDTVMQIVQTLSEKTADIETVADLLNIKPKK
jgi:hypothetical protein